MPGEAGPPAGRMAAVRGGAHCRGGHRMAVERPSAHFIILMDLALCVNPNIDGSRNIF